MISVGIDVSKSKSTVCVLKAGGEVLKPPFEVNHNRTDLNKLINLIKSYDEEVRVILEDTGHYHWPVVDILLKCDIFVCSVNALKMKKFSSQNLRKVKNDKSDSIKIAQYGLVYWYELDRITATDKLRSDLRTLSRQYYQTTSMVVKAKVTLSDLIDQAMPNLNEIITDYDKMVDILEKYIHFDNITEKKESSFVREYCNWAKKKGYRNNERTASELYAAGQIGIPTLPNSISTKVVVKEAVRVYRELAISRDNILAQMVELAKTLPEFSALKEMKGVGDVLAARVIAEIGDVHRFHNKHSLIAYAGIDAPPYQSGQFTATERHITKRGNKYLRKILFEILRSMIKQQAEDEPVYQFIKLKRDQGMPYKKAMVAGMNKFLRVYYGRITELYLLIG